MPNDYFTFRKFTVRQGRSSFRVGTDGVLLGAYAGVSSARRILDIGTGTGLIALMLAQRSDAEIVAIEPDHESFLQCCENINNSEWKSRIRVVESTLQDFRDDDRFDLVVTNPPYFVKSLKNPDSRKSAARHDDSLSSSDILGSMNRLLSDTGALQLILPYVEGTLFIAEAAGYGFFCHDILKVRPLPTSEIRRMILRFSRDRLRTSEKFLTIEYGKRHEFTEEYIELTKDFYLNLRTKG